jgi:hypothetical protein
MFIYIPEHFELGPARPAPSPPTNLTHRAWAEILKTAKLFFARARPEMLFLVVLHYKMRGRPAQARAEKLRPDASNGMVMGRIFSAQSNTIFFRLGPNSARPEKCSPLFISLASAIEICY